MKSLSIAQPWASLMIDGRKKIETRSWAAPQSMIGARFALHAAKSIDKEACRYFCYDPSTIPRGAVLGVLRLVRCDCFSPSYVMNLSPEEIAAGDFSPGRFGFVCEIIERFPQPIPAKGALGFWWWNGQ